MEEKRLAVLRFPFTSPKLYFGNFFLYILGGEVMRFLPESLKYILASTIVHMQQSVNRHLNLLTNPIASLYSNSNHNFPSLSWEHGLQSCRILARFWQDLHLKREKEFPVLPEFPKSSRGIMAKIRKSPRIERI